MSAEEFVKRIRDSKRIEEEKRIQAESDGETDELKWQHYKAKQESSANEV